MLLLSVPYALKAGDAAIIGGLPPSAFVLAAPASGSSQAVSSDASATAQSSAPPPTGTAVTGTGTVKFLPLWDTTSDIISSVLFQSRTGTTAKVGINTRIVKQFGRLRGRRMSAKIALSRRMEPLQTEADRNSGFKHYTLRNWALSGA